MTIANNHGLTAQGEALPRNSQPSQPSLTKRLSVTKLAMNNIYNMNFEEYFREQEMGDGS